MKKTIKKYGRKLEPYNIKKFNSSIIDPIKLIFDKMVYNYSWEEIIKSEIFRQRDKSNNNDIGYFHQNIFSYFNNCIVPKEGWDVVYKNDTGIEVEDVGIVKTIYCEIKNKHNTMNSASSAKIYMKMQNQILNDDNCACFLVEVISKNSKNEKWSTSLDKKRIGHKNIRKISIDRFYALITGEDKAFFKLCLVLPEIIENILKSENFASPKSDSVFKELQEISNTKEISMMMALYLLGFSTYDGFKDYK